MASALSGMSNTTSYERHRHAPHLAYLIAFIVFTGFVFAAGVPFEPRGNGDIAENLKDFGEGNAFRQAVYLSLLGFSFFGAINKSRGEYLKGFPTFYLVVLAYSAVSLTWSIRPDIGLRRLVLGVVFIFIVHNFYTILGRQRFLEMVGRVLQWLIFLSLIAVVVVPGMAKHPMGETDPLLVGMWRGLFVHKNHTAAGSAIAIIYFAHRFYWMRRRLDLLTVFLAVVLLLGSGGKTALGFVLPATLVGLFVTYSYTNRKASLVAVAIALFVFFLAPLLSLLFWDPLLTILSDPMSLTGRVAIWDMSVAYIVDSNHIWTGAGYGSFWQIGDESPLFFYANEPWLEGVFHAHNGYLEVILMIGVPGLILAMFAILVMPVIYLCHSVRSFPYAGGLITSWLTFFMLYNLLEAQFLTKDWQVWYVTVVCAVVAKDCYRDVKVRLQSERLAKELHFEKMRMSQLLRASSAVGGRMSSAGDWTA